MLEFIPADMPISSHSVVHGPEITLDPPPPQPNINCPLQLLLVLVTSTLPTHCPLLPIVIQVCVLIIQYAEQIVIGVQFTHLRCKRQVVQ